MWISSRMMGSALSLARVTRGEGGVWAARVARADGRRPSGPRGARRSTRSLGVDSSAPRRRLEPGRALLLSEPTTTIWGCRPPLRSAAPRDEGRAGMSGAASSEAARASRATSGRAPDPKRPPPRSDLLPMWHHLPARTSPVDSREKRSRFRDDEGGDGTGGDDGDAPSRLRESKADAPAERWRAKGQ